MSKSIVTVICEFCGKDFDCEKWELKRGRRFCSKECVVNAGANKGIKYSKKPKYCIDCGAILGDNRSTRCNNCQGSARRKRPRVCTSCGKLSHPRGYTGTLGLCRSCAMSLHNQRNIRRVEVICRQCNKIFYLRPCEVGDKNFCNWKCYNEWYSATYSGQNSHRWEGGPVKYYGPNWQRQKRLCRKRANYKCERCGKTQIENKQSLDVHHKIPFRTFNYIFEQNDNYLEANNLSNLMAVCRSCHMILENESRESYPLRQSCHS